MSNSTGDPIPIACTLDAAALATRADEWRAFVSSSVTAVEVRERSMRFVLDESDDALVVAASLGAREKACCAFFDVDIELQADKRALRFSVPAGAEEALAEFLALVRS